MKYCSHCANELLDEAVICPQCGCPVAPTPVAKPPRKPIPKKTIILSCVGGFVLLIAIFLAAVFIPSNMKLKDLNEKPNRISALVKYGMPRDLFDEEWVYEKVEFHGIEVDYFMIDFEAGEYTIMEYDDSDQDDLADLLTDKCDYESNSLGLYYDFTYKSLEITAQQDCNYISFKYDN